MTHPNHYPGKTFVPHEGDMPVETIYLNTDCQPAREGIQGVSPEERFREDKAQIEQPPADEMVEEFWPL